MEPMDALRKAIEIVGGQTEMAKKLTYLMGVNITQQRVWNWLHRDGYLPAELAIPIERATGGQVTREELRPDLFGVAGTTPHECEKKATA